MPINSLMQSSEDTRDDVEEQDDQEEGSERDVEEEEERSVTSQGRTRPGQRKAPVREMTTQHAEGMEPPKGSTRGKRGGTLSATVPAPARRSQRRGGKKAASTKESGSDTEGAPQESEEDIVPKRTAGKRGKRGKRADVVVTEGPPIRSGRGTRAARNVDNGEESVVESDQSAEVSMKPRGRKTGKRKVGKLGVVVLLLCSTCVAHCHSLPLLQAEEDVDASADMSGDADEGCLFPGFFVDAVTPRSVDISGEWFLFFLMPCII